MNRIAFYGSSLQSAYWNGAATYYRGIVRALAHEGWHVTFLEPDVWDRARHRDIAPPAWAEVQVWEGSAAGLRAATAQASRADVVIVASGIGYEDEAVLEAALRAAGPGALRIRWDVDAPATLAMLRDNPGHPLLRWLPRLDTVLTYGGGAPVVRAYRALGARRCMPVYNALDPVTHHPVPPPDDVAGDMVFLGNRLPDREARVREFFFGAADRCADRQFLLGGAGWQAREAPANVTCLGHVPTARHNALNRSERMVLNISRRSMAETGFSPATRVVEAAGAAACLVTDAWEGIERFLAPGREVLVARDGRDVAALLEDPAIDARAIGEAALRRVLAEHTYAHRGRALDRLLRRLRAARTEAAA